MARKSPPKDNAAMTASKKAVAGGAKGKASPPSGSAKQQAQLSDRARAIELRKRGRK